MRLKFTKMQGAGNDFVVFDAIRQPVALSPAQCRWLADRHFGIGCDQILLVEPARSADADFRYRIFNADGGEVQQCGNGARCFARFVHDTGLTRNTEMRVETAAGLIVPRLEADGRVTVNMGVPRFAPAEIPFLADARERSSRSTGRPKIDLAPPGGGSDAVPEPGARSSRSTGRPKIDLAPPGGGSDAVSEPGAQLTYVITVEGPHGPEALEFSVLSIGNPHAVRVVCNLDSAPVQELGALIERHPRFPERVNVGFMQVLHRRALRLRVFERGSGETLACGSGACAAVVAGIRRGLLDDCVTVHTRGGELTVRWAGGDAAVYLTGPAERVFEGEIELPP